MSQLIYAKAGYALPHGHNFFIDVLPELGLIGVMVAVLMVVQAFRTFHWVGVGPDHEAPAAGRLVLYVVLALLVFGLTEPMLTVPLGWWSLALVVATARQRELPPTKPGGRHCRTSTHRGSPADTPLQTRQRGRETRRASFARTR